MNVRARYDVCYFITFIDDYKCYGYIYLISYKPKSLDCFRHFMNLVENKKEKAIKI